MKKNFLLIVLFFTTFIAFLLYYNNMIPNDIIKGSKISFAPTSDIFGPIQLNLSEECIFEKGKERYIRIGFKSSKSEKLPKYNDMTEFSIKLYKDYWCGKIQLVDTFPKLFINYYDIPIKLNKIWIDIGLSCIHSYNANYGIEKKVISSLNQFYVFFPLVDSWFEICCDVTPFMIKDFIKGKFNMQEWFIGEYPYWENVYYIYKELSNRRFFVPSKSFIDKQVIYKNSDYKWYKNYRN